jgi:Fe2+ or Zn2+ uptake regulation protein
VAEIQEPHARFDANLAAHHHFTCVRILDVDGPLAEPHAEALRGRISARTGLAITHQRIEFFGRCPQCQSAKARPRRPRRAP